MSLIKSLLVVWKNSNDNLYYHIGTLTYNGIEYIFEYTHKSASNRNVIEAIENGYHMHPVFPDLYKMYKSETLFPAFNRRIPDTSRIGYEDILKELNLPETADRMDVLRKTRGALASDPYLFEEPLRLNGNKLSANFYINGMRHRENLPKNWENYITAGDVLKAELEEDNEHDPFAVKILNNEGLHLGYIPGIYAQAVHSLLKQNISVSMRVKQIRPTFASQWWVWVGMEAILKWEHTGKKERKNLEEFILNESA